MQDRCKTVNQVQTTQTGVQTDITGDYIHELETLNQNLQCQVNNSKQKVDFLQNQSDNKVLSEASLKNNSRKLLFYTGLKSWITFYSIFEIISTALNPARKVSKFDQFMIFFLKIRLSLFHIDSISLWSLIINSQ